jgi:hypothetical protein
VNASRPRACGSVRSQRPLARGDARHREPSRGRSFPGLAGRLHCRPVSTSRTSTTVSQARAKGGRSRGRPSRCFRPRSAARPAPDAAPRHEPR